MNTLVHEFLDTGRLAALPPFIVTEAWQHEIQTSSNSCGT